MPGLTWLLFWVESQSTQECDACAPIQQPRKVFTARRQVQHSLSVLPAKHVAAVRAQRRLCSSKQDFVGF